MTPPPKNVTPEVPELAPGLVESLATAYAELIKRQRTASAAFVRWSTANRRSHEFVWIPAGRESLMTGGAEIRVRSTSPIHAQLNAMMSTIELNPYERELLYGYPYLIGQIDGVVIRAPLLTIPISMLADGGDLILRAEEEIVRFNSLPFRSGMDSAAHELALAGASGLRSGSSSHESPLRRSASQPGIHHIGPQWPRPAYGVGGQR